MNFQKQKWNKNTSQIRIEGRIPSLYGTGQIRPIQLIGSQVFDRSPDPLSLVIPHRSMKDPLTFLILFVWEFSPWQITSFISVFLNDLTILHINSLDCFAPFSPFRTPSGSHDFLSVLSSRFEILTIPFISNRKRLELLILFKKEIFRYSKT